MLLGARLDRLNDQSPATALGELAGEIEQLAKDAPQRSSVARLRLRCAAALAATEPSRAAKLVRALTAVDGRKATSRRSAEESC